MAKIVFFELEQWKKDYVRDKFQGHSVEFHDGPLNAESAGKYPDAEVAGVFIYSKVDGQVLERMPGLKLVTTMSTGFDHIDLEACRNRNVLVSNVPSYGENTVAEHTFALILSLSRKIHKTYVRTLAEDFSINGLEGFDLKNKTLGVIGGGHIGLNVIKIAKGFGMHVLVYDLRHDLFLRDLLHFSYAGLNELLEKSDIITIHTPYMPATHHIIGREQFAKMKEGALFINTARGGLVDTDALYEALKSGHLAGAGLDVIEGEEMIKEESPIGADHHSEKFIQLSRDMEIFKMPSVVFTPHNAFNSKEALIRILDTSIENISSFFAGKSGNVVARH